MELAGALLAEKKYTEALRALDALPPAPGRTSLALQADRVRRQAKEVLEAQARASAPVVRELPKRPPQRTTPRALDEGDSVTHPTFGPGTVVVVDGAGAHATVDFAGTKRRVKIRDLTGA